MPEDVMLREAMEAVRLGQRSRAQDLLTRLLRADQTNPTYWLWMSAVVDTHKERVYCLQTALRLDPGNSAAQQGLILIGAAPPGEEVLPQPPVRRKWQVAVLEEPPTGAKALLKNPLVRLGLFIFIGLVVIGLVAAGVFGFNRRPAAVALRPTRTPGPAPTFTLTPTPLGGIPTPIITPSPTYQGPQPLWMLLEATYTPVPLYVNTPHPISEAFRAGQRALERGDTVTALMFFKQANQVDPNAADILYYIGEVHRMLGDTSAARDAYEQSLAVNPAFAPAYLGMARAALLLNPNADVSLDLLAAIERDPNLPDAHLELAALYLARQDAAAAQPYLDTAASLVPESPLLRVLQARLALLQGDAPLALTLALDASSRDLTLLPAYLVLGQASLANGLHRQAVDALDTYVEYETDDPVGWLALAQAYAGFSQPEQAFAQEFSGLPQEQFESALQAFDRAIEINEEDPQLFLYRGLLYLAQGQNQPAVNDFVSARKLDTKSFPVNLALGRALLAAGRLKEASAQIDGSLDLAVDDTQTAIVLFWRAMAAEADQRDADAVEDWQALLSLPPEALLPGWLETAQQHLAILTGTPTAAASPSPAGALSPTPARTLTPARTPTP